MSDTPRTEMLAMCYARFDGQRWKPSREETVRAYELARQLEREVAELREALEKCRKAFLTDARQKLVVGDETIYQLDGNTVYHALNAAREALAKSPSAQGTFQERE